MTGIIISTNPNGYQLTSSPIRYNNCIKSFVHAGEKVNIIDYNMLGHFCKVESLDKERSGYILKDLVKILIPGVDVGFDPNEAACLI